MTKDRALRDILQEIKTYEDTESKRSSLFESKKQKNIEELIFKVSNAYSYLCIIYPDFTEYNWNQDLGALLPNSNSISDLVENINSVAQEGKSFEKLLKLMHQLYFVHNIQEDVTTNVNINDLLDRAQHMKEIAQNMVDEYETDAEIVLKELADIDKYKTGGVLEKIGIHLPKEYSGFIRTSAMARLLFSDAVPIKPIDIEPYVQRLAEAYMWFGKNNLKTIKRYTGIEVGLNRNLKDQAYAAAVDTCTTLLKTTSNFPFGTVVDEVEKYIHKLSEQTYFSEPKTKNIGAAVNRVLNKCKDHKNILSHIRESTLLVDTKAGNYDYISLEYVS